jgi:Flp pilus assembly protein TadD
LQTAVDLDPLNARALGNLALVRLKQGDTEEAGTLAERARALDPSLTFPGLSLDD